MNGLDKNFAGNVADFYEGKSWKICGLVGLASEILMTGFWVTGFLKPFVLSKFAGIEVV
jgi:hypothetical protein